MAAFRVRHCVAVLVLSVVSGTFVSVALAAVGRTSGDFVVSPSGRAHYTIPLWTPPGIGDVKPQLALEYSSGRGNGLLGIGWDLAGLSAIHRCYKTWAQDGSASPPGIAASDRLCLDGKQLRLDGGAAYGAPNSVYRTELETFSRIKGLDTAGNTVARFEVEGRDGLKYHYGSTSDSRIEYRGFPTTSAPREWALSRIEDRSGNAITFTYSEDTTNGSYRIDKIEYPVSATSGPFYRVQFFSRSRLEGLRKAAGWPESAAA